MATILIIDDDPTTLRLLRTRLEKAGYTVMEAKDGEEGLIAASKERPDLIFLDVRIPKMDGWQVCKTLKTTPRTALTPVIMLTGCSQDTQELYGLQCGADEYITKPWDARKLMEITAHLLKQSIAAHDTRLAVSDKKTKDYVQRVVQMVGKLTKTPTTEPMTNQILQLATSLAASFQTALSNGSDFRSKITIVDKHAEELVYWLSLLRDSKASQDPEIPLLLAEGNVLRETIATCLKKNSKKWLL